MTTPEGGQPAPQRSRLAATQVASGVADNPPDAGANASAEASASPPAGEPDDAPRAALPRRRRGRAIAEDHPDYQMSPSGDGSVPRQRPTRRARREAWFGDDPEPAPDWLPPDATPAAEPVTPTPGEQPSRRASRSPAGRRRSLAGRGDPTADQSLGPTERVQAADEPTAAESDDSADVDDSGEIVRAGGDGFGQEESEPEELVGEVVDAGPAWSVDETESIPRVPGTALVLARDAAPAGPFGATVELRSVDAELVSTPSTELVPVELSSTWQDDERPRAHSHRAHRPRVLRRRRRQLTVAAAGVLIALGLVSLLRLVVPLPPLFSASWLPGHAAEPAIATAGPPSVAPAPSTPGAAHTTPPRPRRTTSPSAPVGVTIATGSPTTGGETIDGDGNRVFSFEAETAELRGEADTRSVTGASGGRIAGHIGEDEDNYVRFTVTVPRSDSYSIMIFYVAGERRDFSIAVNGDRQNTLRCNPTGGWDRVGSTTVRLSLRSGSNSIQFYNNRDWAPDLDRITVTVPPQ